MSEQANATITIADTMKTAAETIVKESDADMLYENRFNGFLKLLAAQKQFNDNEFNEIMAGLCERICRKHNVKMLTKITDKLKTAAPKYASAIIKYFPAYFAGNNADKLIYDKLAGVWILYMGKDILDNICNEKHKPFLEYCAEQKTKTKAVKREMTYGEMQKKIYKLWAELEKAGFKRQADTLLNRFEDEIKSARENS